MKMQEALFAKIKDTMANPKELPKELQTLLNVSSDAAYRRLRGDTELSINEAYILAKQYKVSLADLENFKKDSATFTKRPFIQHPAQFEAFLVRGVDQLKALATDANHEICIAAKDVPAFYQYNYAGLTEFRLFVLQRSVLKEDYLPETHFKMGNMPQHLVTIAGNQWHAYNQLHAIEFWNAATLDGLANQILWCVEAGLFAEKEDALQLCDELQEMLKFLFKQAAYGKRINQLGQPTHQSFKLFYDEVMMLDNSILSHIKGRFIYNLPFGGLNFLSTANEALCADVNTYFLRQMKKSIALTEVSEKQRNLFFQQLRNRVEALRTNILNSVPYKG